MSVAFVFPPTSAEAFWLLDWIFPKIKAEETQTSTESSQTLNILESGSNPYALGTGGADITVQDDALVPESGPIGTIVDLEEMPSSDQISIYVVRSGDTVEGIAKMFDVTPSTVRWANNIAKGQKLKDGEVITILPISGVSHTVKKGDSIASIAKKYGGDKNEIAFFNNFDLDESLEVGAKVIIPDGEVAEVAPKPKTSTPKYTINPVTKKRELVKGTSGPKLSGYFIKPASGIRTQGVHGKNGIDIGAPTGTPIYASASGTVIVANAGGWGGGYGTYAVISHPNGTQTLYAHMSKISVARGDTVSQGEVIGYVGNTGRSTGPHLHFEVRGAKNPGADGSWAK
jgi:murein DD-endopeptidase MepM/ murein hydrolase activator NlpD